MRLVSGIILVIIAVVWGILCLHEKQLLDIPNSVLYAGFMFFAGEKGIDFFAQKLGLKKNG